MITFNYQDLGFYVDTNIIFILLILYKYLLSLFIQFEISYWSHDIYSVFPLASSTTNINFTNLNYSQDQCKLR